MATLSTNKEANLFAKLLSKIDKRKNQHRSESKLDSQSINGVKSKIKKRKIEGYHSGSSSSEESDEESNKAEEEKGIGNIVMISDSEASNSNDEFSEPEEEIKTNGNDVKEIGTTDKQVKLFNKLKSKVEKRKLETKILNDEVSKKQDVDNQEEKNKMDVDQYDESEKNAPSLKEVTAQRALNPKELAAELQKSDFQMLGKQVFEQRRKVKTVLPAWLAYPTVVSNDLSDTSCKIEDVPYISEKIKANLELAGIQHLFPVQKAVIPYILNIQEKPTPFWPRDICCSAPTGSGKTLAFAVPIVQLLMSRVQRKVRALVILPVQELADQVASVFKQICNGTTIVSTLISGRVPLSTEKSRLVEKINGEYHSKVDIVITTAGRLVEHLHSTEGFSLQDLRFLVIDEADRVMDQIQNDWLYHLNKHIKLENETFLMGRSIPLSVFSLRNNPRPPHKLLFSATLSQDPEKIQKFKLFHPKLFTSIVRKDDEADDVEEGLDTQKKSNKNEIRGDFIGKYTTPANLIEKYSITEARLKPLIVYALLKENGFRRFLCFTNSTDASHRLSFVLQELFGDEMVIEELSSSLNIVARKNVLQKFSNFKVNGLISTDALARGIDIPSVDVIISYDVPKHVKTYIHRIGRTARAGHAGTAITLLEKFQVKPFQKILEQAAKQNVEEIKLTSGVEESRALDYANILKGLQKALEKEKKLLRRKTKGQDNDGPKNLLDQIRQQIHEDEARYFNHHIPESWREDTIKQQADVQHKNMQRFLANGNPKAKEKKLKKMQNKKQKKQGMKGNRNKAPNNQ